MTLVTALVAVLVAAVVAVVVRRAHHGRFGERTLLALAGVCGAGLLAMTLSDWPQESLAPFWAQHSVLSATLSTLLLVGAGFLAFEARDNVRQEQLSGSLASAAFGGLVDHMVDLDIALCLLQGPRRPARMQTTVGSPLRWVREHRAEYLSSEADVRLQPSTGLAPRTEHDPWQVELVDQCVRRVMSAMRNWAPLMTPSRDGTGVLVRIGALRNQLVALQVCVSQGLTDDAEDLIRHVRAECTVLALGLELGSGLRRPRDSVRNTAPPSLARLAEAEMADLRRHAEAADFSTVRDLLGVRRAVPGRAVLRPRRSLQKQRS